MTTVKTIITQKMLTDHGFVHTGYDGMIKIFAMEKMVIRLYPLLNIFELRKSGTIVDKFQYWEDLITEL